MDKTKTVCQKWLGNREDVSFWTMKKCAKSQSNSIVLSRVILVTIVKPIFSDSLSEGLETWRWRSIFNKTDRKLFLDWFALIRNSSDWLLE